MGKGFSEKRVEETVFADAEWRVVRGKLCAGRGRPFKIQGLFLVVAEKIPFEALVRVRTDLRKRGLSQNGVYLAHDSMGYARYAGRGNIFQRLKARFNAHAKELKYFSFYVVAEKIHEREIETLVIRTAGPQLQFNSRKKRVTIEPGNIKDYEPRTVFYERQKKKGKKKS